MTGLTDALGSADVVGPWIFVCMVVLWYGIGVRMFTLAGFGVPLPEASIERARSGARPRNVYDRGVRALVREADLRHGVPKKGQLQAVVGPYQLDLAIHADLVRSTAAVSPLLGLLGTVAGMVDMFGMMSSSAEVGKNEGVAAGIALALTATELGLVVAVPGLMIGALLDRRQVTLDSCLDAVVEHLAAKEASCS